MRKIIGIFILALFFSSSCKKQDQLGPDLNGLYGPVTVLVPFAVNTTSVNFSTGGQVYFTAKFQNDAVWKITITGVTSHAVKTITGLSKEITIDNSLWTGTADNAPSFEVENVIATLTFQNSPNLVSAPVNISINGTRVSDKTTDVLVTDFVVSKMICYCALPPAPHDTVPKADWPSDFPPTVNTQSVYGYPDGNPYMIMGDTTTPDSTNTSRPWQGNGSPYVDILTIYPRNSIVNYGDYYPLYADPSKVYFNIMVYNTGTPTWLEITLFENNVAARHIDIKPNWIGWKLISVNYTDMIANTSDAAINIQPQKVTSIQLVLLSNLAVTDPNLTKIPVKTAFDHIIFTHNEPYQP